MNSSRRTDVTDSDWPAALSAALQFVMRSDMLSQHKATLIEVLTQAMREVEAADLRRQAGVQAQREWQDDEIAQLKSLLQDRTAKSWQHADECAMHLAAQLHRSPESVRTKAAELGLAAAVDYRVAKAIKQSTSD